MAVGDFTDIRALRLSRGLTQTQLGRLVGLTQKRIARIEGKPHIVGRAQLQRLTSALGGRWTLVLDPEWRTPDWINGKSSVYFLERLTAPLAKIGKSNDVEFRASTIGDIDLSRSFRLATKNEKAAFRLERVLHRTFHEWRIAPDEATKAGCAFPTEWFKADCRDRLIEFTRANGDLLGCILEPITETSL